MAREMEINVRPIFSTPLLVFTVPDHERINAELRRAILALPPKYRAVIELRHFQDRSYEEIAAALGLPLSDVKSHLFRARKLLRAAIGGGR